MVELQGVRVTLRDKQLEDAEYDYIWRCDAELARLDAAYPLTMTYDRYLSIFQDQLRYPTPGSHHFGIDVADNKFVGNCMYYDLDSINREGEVRYHKTVHFYLMVPTGGATDQHDPEFDVVQWFSSEEALKTLAYANEVEVLRQALELISRRKKGG